MPIARPVRVRARRGVRPRSVTDHVLKYTSHRPHHTAPALCYLRPPRQPCACAVPVPARAHAALPLAPTDGPSLGGWLAAARFHAPGAPHRLCPAPAPPCLLPHAAQRQSPPCPRLVPALTPAGRPADPPFGAHDAARCARGAPSRRLPRRAAPIGATRLHRARRLRLLSNLVLSSRAPSCQAGAHVSSAPPVLSIFKSSTDSTGRAVHHWRFSVVLAPDAGAERRSVRRNWCPRAPHEPPSDGQRARMRSLAPGRPGCATS